MLYDKSVLNTSVEMEMYLVWGESEGELTTNACSTAL